MPEERSLGLGFGYGRGHSIIDTIDTSDTSAPRPGRVRVYSSKGTHELLTIGVLILNTKRNIIHIKTSIFVAISLISSANDELEIDLKTTSLISTTINLCM